VVTRAATAANRMHLAQGFLEKVTARYGGSSQGRQELDGEFVLDLEGALWTSAVLDAARRPAEAERDRVPDRIVVAIDPPRRSGCRSRWAGRACSADDRTWPGPPRRPSRQARKEPRS